MIKYIFECITNVIIKFFILYRQSKRETKGAMRELRKDSNYIDQLTYKEQTEKKEILKAERVKNFGWMEEQQVIILYILYIYMSKYMYIYVDVYV